MRGEYLPRIAIGGNVSDNKLLGLLRKLFGSQKIADKRNASREDRLAFAAYEGLRGSYKQRIRVPVTRNGSTVWVETSIAELGLIQEASSDDAERRARLHIQSMLAAGVVTRDMPTPYDVGRINGTNRAEWLDPRVINPELLVRYPSELPADTMPLQASPEGYHHSNATLPSHYPTVKSKRVRYLYPTEKFRDGRNYSDADFIAHMQASISIAEELLRARNVNIAYHPIAVACSAPPWPRAYSDGENWLVRQSLREDTQGNPPSYNLMPPWPEEARRRGQSVPASWSREYIRGWRKPWGNKSPTGVDGTVQFDVGNALWRDSVNKRQQLTATRPEGLHGTDVVVFGSALTTLYLQTYTADATLDYMAALTILDTILQTSCNTDYAQEALVDMHATATLFDVVQRRSFEQLRLRYGTDILKFQRAIAEEASERANINRSRIVRSVGDPGYNSHGDDVEDITAASIGTLSLAIRAAKDGGLTGALTSVIVSGFSALAAYANSGDAPYNPLDVQLFTGVDGAAVWGIRAGDPGVGVPMIRWGR